MFNRLIRYLERVLGTCAIIAPWTQACAANPLDAREVVARSHPSFRERGCRASTLPCRKSIMLGQGPSKCSQKSPQAYVEAIRAKLGPEIATAELHASCLGFVVCTYSADDPDGEECAEACRDHGPQTWDDVARSGQADHLEACEIVAGWYP